MKKVEDGSTKENVLSGLPGMLPFPPYYWWEAGAMFGQLIDYWYYTNDTTYNQLVIDGIQAQIGIDKNFVRLIFLEDSMRCGYDSVRGVRRRWRVTKDSKDTSNQR